MNKYLPNIVAAAFVLMATFTSCTDDRLKGANRITMVTTFEGELKIYLIGTSRTTISWGDGKSQPVILTDPADLSSIYEYGFQHTYTSANIKTITIAGDNITGLITGWQETVTALDVNLCPSLKYLNCNYEQLTSLNLSKNTELVELKCIGNQLTILDLSKNTKLKDLMCYDNQLTMLNLSNNTALVELGCQNNQLSLLDVSKNTMLKNLLCDGNQLEVLNVSGCTVIETLHCDDNLLSSLDISELAALCYLYCKNNKLNAEALNILFSDLPDRTGKSMGGIDVRNNPGVTETEYNSAIATAKNWSVID